MTTQSAVDTVGFDFSTGDKTVTMLPDPPRQERFHTIVSVDDHVVEPPHTFKGRIPSKLDDRAPHVIALEEGGEAWEFDGKVLPNIGLSAVVGRPPREWGSDPTRFEDMRAGAWDPRARVGDMDLDGVYASLNFPSFLAGFGGGRLQTVTDDRELAFACVRAWNDWYFEEWVSAHPTRFIGCQLPWLHDPERGAAEVRRNAERGVRALTFPEQPDRMGLPSMFTSHWDPIMRACEETGTVVCIHTGSGGALPDLGIDAPPALASLVFGSYSLIPTAVWLYSMVPVRFPNIKISVAEGGIGWVAGLLDRLDHLLRHRENRTYFGPWFDVDILPSEVMRRNFWFCAVDDPSAWVQRDRIGVDRLLLEVDYPHPDCSWPNTQRMVRDQMTGMAPDEVEQITWANASDLFQHPVPVEVQRDPNAF